MGGDHGGQHGIRVPLIRDIERMGKQCLGRTGAERFKLGERGV
jgi:hypothetical protein